MNQDFIIIANGSINKTTQLADLVHNKIVIALDGAANYLIDCCLKIDILMGDFDSISPTVKNLYQQYGVNVIDTLNQDYTDLEKSIHYCDEQQANSITIVNAQGGRMDHSIGNICFLKKYYRVDRLIQIINDDELLYYVEDQNIIINGYIDQLIGIMGFAECIVTSCGLKYELNSTYLSIGGTQSISNSLNSTSATVQIAGQALIIQGFK